MLKVYVSVPIIRNRNLLVAKAIASVVTELGHEVVSKWVLEDLTFNDVNIFERDTEGVRSSDILIADVSSPSTGVGMEIMLAYMLGKPIFVVAKRGSRISRMLLHMKGKKLIEFSKVNELREMLKNELIKISDHERGKF